MDEKQTIARLKQGDLAGLEVLVRMYQLKAVRAASLITGDPALAEDIVQNAFIRAGERIVQFDAQRPFEPWFMRSVVHDAIKAANRQKRQVSIDQGEEGTTLNLLDPASSPEEQVESKEMAQAVWRALQNLPPNQRAAIIMRYYLGMHEDEISTQMKSAPGTARWWLYAARQRLAKLLDRFQPLESVKSFERQSLPDHEQSGGE